jgi:hypothetical protein
MGIILSGGGAASSGGAGSLVSASTTYVAGEAVQQGQLANLGLDGLAYYSLDPLGPGGALRPLAGQLANAFPYAAGPANAFGLAGSIVGGCVLTSGNAVVFTAQGGVLQFGIYNSLGVLQGQLVTVATNVSPRVFMAVAALSNGGFAFSYVTTVGAGQPCMAVYNALGAVVQGPTLVESGTSAASMSIAALLNGGFVIAYNSVGDASCRYAVYSNTGAVVKATASTTMGSMSLTSPCGLSVAALADGGFVVVGLVMNGTNASGQFSRYNAAGVAQQTNVTAVQAGTSNTIGTICAVGLSGGGFVIAGYYGPSSATYVAAFTSAGVQVGATFVASSYGNNSYPGIALVARPGGTDAILTSPLTAASVQVTVCLPSGVAGGTASSNALGTCNAIAVLANGHIVIAGTGPNMVVFDSNLASVGSVPLVSLGLNAGTLSQTPACVLPMAPSALNPAVPLALTCTTAAGIVPKLASIATVVQGTQKTTPVGVFGASAAAGSAVPVQFMGLATLATSFVQPYVVDANGNVPPGQRMSIIGNQAILNGIQATTRRQIN